MRRGGGHDTHMYECDTCLLTGWVAPRTATADDTPPTRYTPTLPTHTCPHKGPQRKKQPIHKPTTRATSTSTFPSPTAKLPKELPDAQISDINGFGNVSLQCPRCLRLEPLPASMHSI